MDTLEKTGYNPDGTPYVPIERDGDGERKIEIYTNSSKMLPYITTNKENPNFEQSSTIYFYSNLSKIKELKQMTKLALEDNKPRPTIFVYIHSHGTMDCTLIKDTSPERYIPTSAEPITIDPDINPNVNCRRIIMAPCNLVNMGTDQSAMKEIVAINELISNSELNDSGEMFNQVQGLLNTNDEWRECIRQSGSGLEEDCQLYLKASFEELNELTSCNRYYEKIFNFKPDKIFTKLGVYIINMFNLTDLQTEVFQQSGFKNTGDSIKQLIHILNAKGLEPKIDARFTHIYYKFTLSDIINFFIKLGFIDIYLIDSSCEVCSDISEANSKLERKHTQSIEVMDKITGKKRNFNSITGEIGHTDKDLRGGKSKKNKSKKNKSKKNKSKKNKSKKNKSKKNKKNKSK